MLYDGALQSVTAAAEAAARRDIRARQNAISRALAIVSELQSCLDMDGGGAIAAELDRLYTWMTSRLIDATVRQEAKPIQEVRRVLEILRDSWQEVAAGTPAGAAP
jgi:flagellar protein FliS